MTSDDVVMEESQSTSAGGVVDDFQQKSDLFMEWLSNLPGVEISSKVKLTDLRAMGKGRGVVAIADIEADEALVTIPRIHVLNAATSTLPNHLPVDTLSPDRCDPWTALILTLIYEHCRGAYSAWHSYLDILPESFNTLMFWSDAELEELQASAVRAKIGKDEAEASFRANVLPIIREHPEVFFANAPSTPPPDGVLLSLAHRFASTIMAYAFDLAPESNPSSPSSEFSLEETPEGLPKSMVPLADFFNHDAPASPLVNTRQEHEPTALVMRTLRAVNIGEELVTDHGPVPRADLLRRCGYITAATADYDVVEIERKLLEDAVQRYRPLSKPDQDKRLGYLEGKEALDDSYDFHRASTTSVGSETMASTCHWPSELLILLQTLLAPESMSFKAAFAGTLSPSQTTSLNIDVGRVLIAAVQTRLQQYQTSAAADSALLKNLTELPQGSRRRSAVEVRLGEKQILADALNEAAAMVRAGEAERAMQAAEVDARGESGRPEKRRRVL